MGIDIMFYHFSTAEAELGPTVHQFTWPRVPRTSLRESLASAASGRACKLNLSGSIQTLGPQVFLDVFWAELCATTNTGDLVGPRQVGLFVLTASLPKPHPPLLPLFLNHTVPAFLSTSNMQDQVGPQNIADLLAALIASSLLVTLHYERAMTVTSSPSCLSANALARGILGLLRAAGSEIATLIARQILSFPSFGSHFSPSSLQ